MQDAGGCARSDEAFIDWILLTWAKNAGAQLAGYWLRDGLWVQLRAASNPRLDPDLAKRFLAPPAKRRQEKQLGLVGRRRSNASLGPEIQCLLPAVPTKTKSASKKHLRPSIDSINGLQGALQCQSILGF